MKRTGRSEGTRDGMPPSLDQVPGRFHADLQELDQMSAEMLWQIAQADLPDEKAALYESLLEKNQNDELGPAEQEVLETLREETDLLMLRRAYAYTLLKWRGYRIPAPSIVAGSFCLERRWHENHWPYGHRTGNCSRPSSQQ